MAGCFCTGQCMRTGRCPAAQIVPLAPYPYRPPYPMPQPQPFVPPRPGWVCPVCGAVMAPWMPTCTNCKPKPPDVSGDSPQG